MKHYVLNALIFSLITTPLHARFDENSDINFELIGEGEDDPEKSVFHKPEQYEKYFLIGTKKFRAGDLDGAIENYALAIKTNSRSPQPYFNMGLALEEKERTDEAIEAYKNAIALKPEYAKAHMQLAKIFEAREKFNEAIHHYKEAIKHDKKLNHLSINTARLLCRQERFAESLPYFESALNLKPDDVMVRFEYANTLNTTNNTAKALTQYQTLLTQRPNDSGILYNTAYTLKKLGRLEEAMPYYNAALKKKPDHAEAHFSLGLAHLITGDFEKGWPEYEWRWQRGTQLAPRELPQPQWDGTPLNGKRILVHAEQGLGDTFQFIRYAKVVKEQYGGQLIVAVQSPLHAFVSRCCPYIDRVIALSEIYSVQCDFQIPLMTLPLVLKTVEKTIPTEIPYIMPDAGLIEHWKQKISPDTNFKVGICWQGNSKYSTPFLRSVVAAKSIKLNQFAPLGSLSGVSFYSLQKDTGTDQLDTIPKNLNLIVFDDLDEKNGRFMDTAALIKNLDLVITIDTSISHLAAAIGTPVWIMVPEPPDWRWMIERTDTPWYPHIMQLFRQPTPGDWDSVIQTICTTLESVLNAHQGNSNHTKKTSLSAGSSSQTQLEHELLRINKKLTLLSNSIKNSNASPDNAEFVKKMKEFYFLSEMRNQLQEKIALISEE